MSTFSKITDLETSNDTLRERIFLYRRCRSGGFVEGDGRCDVDAWEIASGRSLHGILVPRQS